MSNAKSVFVIDVLPYFLKLNFKDRTKCFVSKFDHHYSEVGHQVVADALYSEMRKFDLLDALERI